MKKENIKLLASAVCILLTPALFSCGDKGDSIIGSASSSNPDLAYNELKGPVKMVTFMSDDGSGPYINGDYFYDEDGTWLNLPRWQGDEQELFYPDYKGDKAERDNEGKIIKLHEIYWGYVDIDNDIEECTILWDKGRIKQKTMETRSFPEITDVYYYSQEVTDYTYDEKGYLTQEVSNSTWSNIGEGGKSTTSKTYSYVDFDDKGNWTKRFVTSTEKYGDGDPQTSHYTELREILYY